MSSRLVAVVAAVTILWAITEPSPAILNAPCGDAELLVDGLGFFRARPDPSGTALAYFRYSGEDRVLLVVQSLTSASPQRSVLSDNFRQTTDVSWNPRKDIAAFLRIVDKQDIIVGVSGTGAPRFSISIPDDLEGGLAWLSDGRRIAVGVRNAILLYDTTSGQLERRLELDPKIVSADLSVLSCSAQDVLAFSGAEQAAAGENDRTRIWIIDMRDAEPTAVPVSHGPLDHSPTWIGAFGIAYSRVDTSKSWQCESTTYSVKHLWHLDTRTGREVRLTDGLTADDRPTWISSKKMLAFSRIPFADLSCTDRAELPPHAGRPFSAILEALARENRFVAERTQVGSLNCERFARQ